MKTQGSGFGRGKWKVAVTSSPSGDTNFGVWSDQESDLICIAPDQNGNIASICLRIVSDGHKKVPLKLDAIRYDLSPHGKWQADVDDNPALEYWNIAPISDIPERLVWEALGNEAAYTLYGDLTGMQTFLLANDNYDASIRIALIRGNWNDRFDNHSRFVFVPTGGFRMAWNSMLAMRYASYQIAAKFCLKDGEWGH